jgi:hypothetical protein
MVEYISYRQNYFYFLTSNQSVLKKSSKNMGLFTRWQTKADVRALTLLHNAFKF